MQQVIRIDLKIRKGIENPISIQIFGAFFRLHKPRFYVDAETREEALSMARQKYQHGDFILEPGHLLDVKFIPLATDEE